MKQLFLLLLLPFFAIGQMKEVKYNAPGGTGVRIDADGHSLSAAVFLPENYESRSAWPTILFFHGAGEASSTRQYNELLENGLPKNIKAGLSVPYIVIAVQDQWSTPSPSVIDYTLKNTFLKAYKIDTSHIYATGLSYGGGGSLAVAIAHPEYISAVVSASPATLQPVEVQGISAVAVNKIPVWFWYGSKDNTGPYNDNAKSYSAKILAAGGQSWITTEPVSHGPWDNLYTGKTLLNGKTIYTFFDQYGKTVVPPVIPPGDTVITPPARKLIATLKVYDNGDIEKQ